MRPNALYCGVLDFDGLGCLCSLILFLFWGFCGSEVV